MKKILVAATLIGTTVAAQAADLPAKAPYYKAPVAQVYNWTGFYLGVNAGVGIGRSNTNLIDPVGGTVESSRLGGMGALGGGQIGYNWQYGNLLGFSNVVLGLEADIQGSGLRDNRTCLGAGDCVLAGTQFDQKLGWFGTVRGRVGLATGPVLSYFTGGFAYGGADTAASIIGAPGLSSSTSNTLTGWTIGSGVEAALGGNWTGKIEYLYLDLGNQSGGVPGVYAYGSDIREHIFRVGLNYRIGGTGLYAAAPAANWAGLYGGLNAGGATALNRSSLAGPGALERFNLSPDGLMGGVQVGYNLQSANWVYGLEADFQGSTQQDDRVCVAGCSPAGIAAYNQKMQWLGTVRGRVGYSVGDSLFYATGGLAYGNVKTRIQANDGVGGFADVTFDKTRTGYAVGGGVESPFDLFGLFGRNWTSKTEYLFVDLGRTTDTIALGGVDFTTTSKVQEHIFRTGLNYHFNSPVVAKY